MIPDAIRTTDGTIALFNLHAQIAGLERQSAQWRLTSRTGAELVDLLMLRGHVLGRIADYERASELAEYLAREFPADGPAFLARARSRACLHRFEEALADLKIAERVGPAVPETDAERATILQAVGRYEEALVMHRAAVERRRSFETLGALAAFHAELGEVSEAELLFDESRAHFRGVSPFGLAQLDFQRAHLWLAQGELRRARDWLLSALRRLPAYVPVEGHLAEVEAELGEPGIAVERLRRLADTSDDPDYATQLARILAEMGRFEDAAPWRAWAQTRYDELMTRYPAAFADHAAEFYLTIGGNPQRAVQLAKFNVDVRPSPRAHALLARAIAASATEAPRDAA